MNRITICCLLLFVAFGSVSQAQDPVTTQHQVKLADGQVISYSATAGYLDLPNEAGSNQARIFFVAYLKDGEKNPAERPLTFSFNGGPGSSSVWLHMGALGPKRVRMTDEGGSIPPPYEVIDNPHTWLGFTDLVFIDPVETGYSRPAPGIDKKKFLGFENDLKSVGQFIQLYLSQNERWSSPKYLAGESYGTTRAAGLAGHLQDRYGLFLNGLVQISQVTNFQTIRFAKGNDLPHALFLPTFAATAWYHGQVDKSKYPTLADLLPKVEAFAKGDYTLALMQGDEMEADLRTKVRKELAEYTGLSETYLDQCHLRLQVGPFNKELLRKKGEVVGRLDSRFKNTDYDDTGDSYEFDPSYSSTIYGPFTTAVYEHLGRNLKFQSHLPYEILTGRVRPWAMTENGGYLNVAETLRQAMHKNRDLQVLICNGYYDLATPYFATEYTLDHMFLEPDLKQNIEMKYYESGHMMYIHLPSLVQMTKDVKGWYAD
ncbi:MAG: peptidase S10 [Bacteroidota bacterium]